MNTNQKITLLFADYTIRIIAARIAPDLAQLKPIRSIESIADAYAFASSINFYVTFTDVNMSQNEINRMYIANLADLHYMTHSAYFNIYNAANAFYFAARNNNVDNYAIDIRALFNIACNPNKYW